MSKKIAGGARGIVIDVKTGSGAFLPKLEDSRRLARSLVSIGVRLGRRMSALITDMSQPLGHRVGNALEVREAVEALRGQGPQDLETLCCELGAELLLFAGKASDHSTAVSVLRGLLYDGGALAKFQEMVRNQGGNPAVVDDLSLLPTAARTIPLEAPRSGTVAQVDALSVGRAANLLGAGRFVKEDRVDQAVGLEILRKVGERVEKGAPLAILHVNDETNLAQAKSLVARAFTIGEGPIAPPPLIVERVGAPATL